MLRSLCAQFFNQPYTDQIRHFLLPTLACSRNAFPFVDLLHALLNTGCGEADSKNKIRSTPWLLHSVMTLAAERLGTSCILSLGVQICVAVTLECFAFVLCTLSYKMAFQRIVGSKAGRCYLNIYVIGACRPAGIS